MKGEKYWDRAWSLVDGCTPVSEACDHCWLEAMNHRFHKWEPGTVTTIEDRLDIPLRTRKPTVWAIWSDLFHEAVPDEFIDDAYRVMFNAPQHTYLILTKRADRLADFYDAHSDALYFDQATSWIWHGVTVENQEQAGKRIPKLLKVPGKKFLSIEPMLGPIDLTNICITAGEGDIRPWCDIHAVIVGAESGHGARPMKLIWTASIVEKCKAVPVFVKQIHLHGKLSKDMSEWPEALRVRELPWASS